MQTDSTVYQFKVNTIDGNETSLEQFRGKVLLIVNVASKCGLTPQYEELQKLYEMKKDEGLVVLGFPANNFAGQEPGTNAEIKSFCTANYGVTFPMFSKISVKGKDIHPLYAYLTQKDQNGVFDAPVKWNFQKFLIDRSGKPVEFFAPQQSVMDDDVMAAIERELRKQ